MSLLAQTAQVGADVAQNPTAEAIVFWIFAVVGIGAALAVVTMRNIVHSALMLVVNLLAIAVLYLALQSQFLGIVQVIVYAGAIMVLFLFVIMLLGVDRDDLLVDTSRWHRAGAIAGGVLLVAGLLLAFSGSFGAGSRCGTQADPAASTTALPCEGLEAAVAANEEGSVGIVAERMFTRYTFPFEAASLLLVVATIGALVLGRRTDPPREGEPALAPTAGAPGGEGEAVDSALDTRSGPSAGTTPEGTPSDADRLLPGSDEEDR